MEKEFSQIIELVRECGSFIKNADYSSIRIASKEGHANFVTEYDKKVQARLSAGLLAIIPDASFIGEEGEQEAFTAKGKFFIVDPIDGTTNFIKNYHMSCVSVALIEDGVAKYGVVYNPYIDEMFYAQKGQGAYCNGMPIHTSCEPLSNGIVLFGSSPYYENLAEQSFKLAYSLFTKALDIRRSGSAALDLCSIASGRAELYFELILSPWDYAAGGLILEEAGGSITDLNGNPIIYDKPCPIIASNGSFDPIAYFTV